MSSAPSLTDSAPRFRYRRQLAWFAVLCLLISWVPLAALAVTGVDAYSGSALVVFTLATSGPTLAALLMWLWHRRQLPRRRVRVIAWWPLLSILLGAAPMLLVSALANWNELEVIPVHAASMMASVGGPLAVLAYTFLAGPLSEEFGWRGYVQPRLRTALGRAQTAVLLGSAWALWHVPLFFLVGTGQHETGLLTFQGAVFFVTCLPLSYIILFAYEHLEGGVWSAVLIHAAWNATDALVPAVDDTGQVLRLVLTLALAIAVAAYWRAKRRATGVDATPVATGAAGGRDATPAPPA
jgi:membrane protease YdiL (CAAX protease family)